MKRLLLAVCLAGLSALAFGQLRGPSGQPGATTTYTGTAGTTSTFGPGPGSVLVFCTTQCYVTVGEGVTATTSDVPLPANTPAFLPVPPGTGAPWRVSAIQQSTGGSVFAKPFN